MKHFVGIKKSMKPITLGNKLGKIQIGLGDKNSYHSNNRAGGAGEGMVLPRPNDIDVNKHMDLRVPLGVLKDRSKSRSSLGF